MIYILIIFIIYLILLIKYYFRYYLPEIIQLPENQNINNYFYNNNRNIIIFKKNSSLTLSNIKEFQNEKLITIYNSNQKIKIPGKVFLVFFMSVFIAFLTTAISLINLNYITKRVNIFIK